MFSCPHITSGPVVAIASCILAATSTSASAQPSPCPDSTYARLDQTVTDRATRIPLAGAVTVATWSESGIERSARLTADSVGRGVLCAPAGRPIALRASYFSVHSDVASATLNLARPTSHTITIDLPGFLLRGNVLDDVTQQPIANVAVRIVNTNLSVLSGADGRFTFAQLPIGDYHVKVEHISYATSTLHLAVRHDDLDAEIRMAPDAIPLMPIKVTAFSRRLERFGFYEREKRGIGTFIGRRQIDEMKAQNASDLLRSVPGVRLTTPIQRRNTPRSHTTGRGSCRFRFIVDGTRVLSDYEIDYLHAGDIEGIEVYGGLAEVPAEFRAQMTSDPGAGTCGVIAIWTRDSR